MNNFQTIDLDNIMRTKTPEMGEYNNDSDHNENNSTESDENNSNVNTLNKKARFNLNKNKYNSSSDFTSESNRSNSMLKKVANKFRSNKSVRQSETLQGDLFYVNDALNIDMLDNNTILKKIQTILEKIKNSENINNKDFIKDVFEMFKDKYYVMFVKQNKLNFYDIGCMSCNLIRKRSCSKIDPNDFRGCLFLPIEEIEKILLILDTYNKILTSNHINNKVIEYSNDTKYLFIHFDENSIKKNHLYKRLDILNKINFISFKEYQTKITEYKIRGLCQIAEELGAKEIDIHFEKNLKNTILKESTVNMEINSIAGNLGLKRSETDEKNENHSYTLNYGQINNIELNDYEIINKIKNHKLFISEKMFHSNLELQYLISSRCRHFITNYNTTFNIDTETAIDKEIEAKFKKSGYSIGVSSKNSKTISNHLKICTDIKFYSIDDYNNYITGDNVPFNECGFNHLMSSLNYGDEDKFINQGIYKIMNFINSYVYKVLIHIDNNKYKKVFNILQLIKKRMTINEYAQCLFNYFNLNSTWVQFTYFIDVLADNTKSIDDIRYLIIYDKYETKRYSQNELLEDLISLIQNKCKKLEIEDKFYKMLRPNSLKTKFILIYFIINDYKLLKTFNLFELNNLINNIRKYEIYIDSIQYNNVELEQNNGNQKTVYKYFTLNEYDIKNEIFLVHLNNIKLGFTLWEFYSNMVPFIYEIYLVIFNHHIQEKIIDIKDKIYYNDLFNSFINYDDFITSNITSFKLLLNYINDIINIIKSGLHMKTDIMNEYLHSNIENNNDICSFLIKYMINNNKYSFFTIKLNFIIDNNYQLLKTFINNIYTSNKSKSLTRQLSFDENDNNLIISNNEKFIYNFIKKIISYNHRNIDINSIPLNKFGFELIIKNYLVGIKEIEFNKLILPFTQNVINYIYKYNNKEYEMSKLDIFDDRMGMAYSSPINYTHNDFIKTKYIYSNYINNIININDQLSIPDELI
jgi:hypothetical protein